MTGFIKPLRKLQPAGGKYAPSVQIAKSFIPDLPAMPETPAAPTIDEATRTRQDSDRLRRRRGVYANIFAGSAAAPSVGKPTLGG